MMRDIFVELLDEGVPTWRPTKAIAVRDGGFLVLPTDDYDPEDEKWAFPPGSLVCLRDGVLRTSGKVLIADRLAE